MISDQDDQHGDGDDDNSGGGRVLIMGMDVVLYLGEEDTRPAFCSIFLSCRSVRSSEKSVTPLLRW